MFESLIAALVAIRDEYKLDLSEAMHSVEVHAGNGDLSEVSHWSTLAERKREAVTAIDRCIAAAEQAEALDPLVGALRALHAVSKEAKPTNVTHAHTTWEIPNAVFVQCGLARARIEGPAA